MYPIRISSIFSFLALVESVKINKTTGKTETIGSYSVTYDEDVSDNCETIVMIGVGTAMEIGDYDVLASSIPVKKPIVAVIFDPDPGNMIKYDAKDHANFYDAFTANLSERIPICKGKSPKLLAGGHSASGRGGLQAIMHYNIGVHGFVALDSWQVSQESSGSWPNAVPATSIAPDLPVLAWGLEETTCSATVDIGGKAAYEIAGVNNRVFYRINNMHKKIGHCEFSDEGCFPIPIPGCPKPKKGENTIKSIVAKSIQVFASGVVNGTINPKDFNFDRSNDLVEIDLFVNSDDASSVESVL